MIRFLTSVIIVFVIGPAFAEEKRIFSGAGVSTCGRFIRLYLEEPMPTTTFYFSWVQGFMAAQNIALANSSKTYRSLEGETEQQQEFIRAYCEKNTDATFASAAMALYLSMPLRNLK